MNFLLFLKLVLKLWKLTQSLIINFLKILVFYSEHFHLFWLAWSCRVCVVWWVWDLLAHLVQYSNFESFAIFIVIWEENFCVGSVRVGLQLLFEAIELTTADQNFIFEVLSGSVAFDSVFFREVVIAEFRKGCSSRLDTVVGTSVAFPDREFFFGHGLLWNMMSHGQRGFDFDSSRRFAPISVLRCQHLPTDISKTLIMKFYYHFINLNFIYTLKIQHFTVLWCLNHSYA